MLKVEGNLKFYLIYRKFEKKISMFVLQIKKNQSMRMMYSTKNPDVVEKKNWIYLNVYKFNEKKKNSTRKKVVQI